MGGQRLSRYRLSALLRAVLLTTMQRGAAASYEPADVQLPRQQQRGSSSSGSASLATCPWPHNHAARAPRPPMFKRRWNANRDAAGRWSYEGWQRAVAAVEAALAEHGPFDGLMGFSQVGAAGWGCWKLHAGLESRSAACTAVMVTALPFCNPISAAHACCPCTPQGGAMASLAAGMQRAGFALKAAPPLRFVLCFAGIRCGQGA